MIKKITSVGIVLAVSYAVMVTVMFFRQDGIVYFPDREMVRPADVGMFAIEEIPLKTEDGLTIWSWYAPAREERASLIFCHGNAGNLTSSHNHLTFFNSMGISVLAFDYRGYGKSEGRPTEEGTYRDAEAAWRYLTEVRGKPVDTIILYGHSLGGAVAAELATRRRPAALILESAFTSLPDLGEQHYPWLPVRLISRYKYGTIDKIASVSCPKLIIHSPADEIIPFSHGKTLYEKAAPPKEFLVAGGGHNDAIFVSRGTFQEGIRAFLEKHTSIR